MAARTSYIIYLSASRGYVKTKKKQISVIVDQNSMPTYAAKSDKTVLTDSI